MVGTKGQRLLLARRLVESEFVVLTVYGGWDNHDNVKGSFEDKHLP